MMKRLSWAVAALALLLGGVGQSKAEIIIYSVEATATGSLGSNNFLAPDEPTLCFRVTFLEMVVRVTSLVMVAEYIVNWLRAGGGTPRGPSRLKPA
jgi:hypothetical protein